LRTTRNRRFSSSLSPVYVNDVETAVPLLGISFHPTAMAGVPASAFE
jgi:hypothetical protein